jgi:serine/threonine protein kinase/tetratricopeptide (TPR) repeat protein
MRDGEPPSPPGAGPPPDPLEPGHDLTAAFTVSGSTTRTVASPRAFGRYEVRGVRGSGGFGTVYAGWDASLEREVAIKVPSAALLDEGSADLFLVEARNLARLRHPGIVTVFDVGIEDGRCFIVSELLDGQPLSEWAKGRTLPWREVAELIARIAEALAHAHERTIVHRDVKPGNVIITRDRGPVLVDFGLAITDSARASELGAFRGTPSFMSPEQVAGRAHRIDGRTDIYSLGVTLYAMLCGRLPFRAASLDELLRQVAEDDPQPPRQLVPNLPPEIERVCLTAMARATADRYTTALDMAHDLRALIQEVPAPDRRAERRTPPPAAADRSAATPVATLSARAQRRHLTFVSLSWDASDGSDLLEVDERADLDATFQRRIAEVAAGCGGTVLRSGSSSVDLCFGYPVAQEDAPRRAVHAALEIRDLFRSGPPMSRAPLQVWIAVHTGTVIVHAQPSGPPEVTGEAFTLVRRLESVIPPDEVVVTRDVRRLVSRHVDLEEAGRATVRGARDPVELFRVVGSQSGDLSMAAGLSLTPLVGRDQEMGLLFDRWAQTREGVGQAVMLAADAGLGKSRLVHVLKEHVTADGDLPIVEWRCSPSHAHSALYPAIDYWARALGFAPGDADPRDRLERLKQYLRGVDLPLAESVPLVGSLMGLPEDDEYPSRQLSPQRQKELTIEWIAAWLAAKARHRPLLFIVEDLHWVDPSTLDLLVPLVDAPLAEPIMCVFTFRPEFGIPWTSRRITQIALNRLTRAQVAAMIRSHAGVDALPGAFVDRVIERTDGVPLFIEELTKVLAESGRLDTFDATSSDSVRSRSTTDPWSRLTVPESLQDLLMARLDRHGGNNAVVQVAAAIGREFGLDLLSAASGLSEAELGDALDRLVRAELVHRHGRPPAVTYVFKHALIQDAAYESMVKKERARVHGAIADALAARFPDVVAREPETQAHHLTEAGRLDEAIDFWQAAGHRAIQRSTYPEAFAHLTRGTDLLRQLPPSPERDRKEYGLNVPLGIASLSIRGYASPELGELYERRYQLCEQMGDDMGRLHAIWALSSWRIVRSEQDIARDLGLRIVQLADRIDDDGARMEAYFIRQIVAFYRGEFRDAERFGTEAMARYEPERCLWHTARLGQHAGIAALSYLALTQWHLGRPDTALRTMAQAVEMTHALKQPFMLAFVLYHSALLHKTCRLGNEAQRAGEAQIAVAREQGFSFWEATGTLYRAGGLVEQGRHQDASEQIVAGLARFEAHGAALGLPFYRSYLAEACLGLGELDAAEAALAGARAAIETSAERFHEAEVQRLQGVLALQRGDHAAAREHLEQAIATSRAQGARGWELRATLWLDELMARSGHEREGRERLAAIHATFDEGFQTPDLLAAAARLQALA